MLRWATIDNFRDAPRKGGREEGKEFEKAPGCPRLSAMLKAKTQSRETGQVLTSCTTRNGYPGTPFTWSADESALPLDGLEEAIPMAEENVAKTRACS
ncbi:uncharacterized protein UV8b_07877 [Ustilaginoidea virens]|uniref:Uncharacterized protein n=1 Tax=Ustilaginoidea virens TaxID=1159556 RepID=A0A8E5HY20_USTVR|nr:uncharacterized protein UV8b_07877 [Ustilaginoidea virens]QUC23636.1 hypothetical protein UV8b_07877 [Ustilaginoidea virens]